MTKKKTKKKKTKEKYVDAEALEANIERESLETEIEHVEPEPVVQDRPLKPMNSLAGLEVFDSSALPTYKIRENMWVVVCGKCEMRYSHQTDMEKDYGDTKHYSECSHCNALNRVEPPPDQQNETV